MGTLISLDFDFFPFQRHEAGEETITIHPGTPKAKTLSTLMLYDWGMNESRSPALQGVLWMSRYASLARCGLDPLAEVGIRPEKGCVTPATFAQHLGRVMPRMADAPLWTADSHAHGLTAAQEASARGRFKPIRCVHFDAHHDLGYHDTCAEMWRKKRSVDCGSWLYGALDAGFVKSVDIVYPDWRGMVEWKRNAMEKAPWLKGLRRRIHVYTWSEWKAANKKYEDVLLTFLCRSSAWTPPWLDGEFDALIRALDHNERTCLDCMDGMQRIGGHDSCQPRAWDVEEARRNAAAMEEAYAACRAGSAK